MRILYGVQTTGRGHLVRSRPMVAALRSMGHEVHTLFSGPTIEQKWLDPIFAIEQARMIRNALAREWPDYATEFTQRLAELGLDLDFA